MRRMRVLVPLFWMLSLAMPLLGFSPAQAQHEAVTVNIVDFAFDPGSITVAAGTTVTWTNNDTAPHTVTADDGTFDSGTLDPGESFSWTFEQAGSVSYFCAIHPNMTAAVEVVGASEAATPTAPAEAAAEEIAVNIAGFAFDPASLEIAAGTTVTWTNNDTAPHTVSADNRAFDSGTLEPGDTFSWTFDQAGSIAYHCEIHPDMTATVEVGEAEEEEQPTPPPPPPPPPADEEQPEEEAAEPAPAPTEAPAAPPAEEEPAGAQGGAVTVSIANFAFDPGSIDVAAGMTVTWTNNDTAPHTVTADDGSFDSGTLEPGDSFSFTFDQAGSFSYFCAIHPNMTGVVNVGDAAAGEEPPPASPAAGGEPAIVGVSVDGGAAIWIMGKIEQRAGSFSLFGFVNHIEGIEAAALFTDPEPANWNEGTARFTVFGEATMLSSFVLAERISTVSAEGTLQFFFNQRAGASFGAPESFFSGEQIAEAELDFRQSISVYAEQEGIADGAGSFALTTTSPFTLDGTPFQLGQSGQRHDMTATGLGTLTDPTEPRATLDVVVRTETVAESGPPAAGVSEAATAGAETGDALTIELAELNDSDVSGSATLTPNGEETEVSVQLQGAAGGHPAHIHLGTCDALDPNPEYPLESIAADGTSVTTVPVSMADLEAGQLAINIHESVDNIGRYIACGNIARS